MKSKLLFICAYIGHGLRFGLCFLESPANFHNKSFHLIPQKPWYDNPKVGESWTETVDGQDKTTWIEMKEIFAQQWDTAGLQKRIPKFGDTINNVTVSVGREATFTCIVDDLGSYRVAWLRVDTQTILTIATHVITKNHRIAVQHSDRRAWFLRVLDVRQADRGFYMCQINTDPMKSQTAYLDVVVPPDIVDEGTSGDQVAREGGGVSLRCAAHGVPKPTVLWRREAGDALPADNYTDVNNSSVSGAIVTFSRVNRLHMGAYLCIASNGVPPSVSKRAMLIVHFPPMVWIQNQLIGSREGESVRLECHSEAFPKSINYWTVNEEIISQADKNYEISIIEKGYEVDMYLKIKKVTKSTYGSYRCVSKNSLGDTDGTIKLYPISNENLNLNFHHKNDLYENAISKTTDENGQLSAVQSDASTSVVRIINARSSGVRSHHTRSLNSNIVKSSLIPFLITILIYILN